MAALLWLATVGQALVVLSARDVSADILTGTWTQETDAKCKTVLDDGTKQTMPLVGGSIEVSQTGTAVNARLFGVILFYGRAIHTGGVLVRCANNALGKVAVYIKKVQMTSAAPDGVMKAILYDVEPGSLGVCKVTFRRTSTADPGLPPC